MMKFPRNRFFILIMIIILLFAVWNLSWYLIITSKYHRFVKDIPKNVAGMHLLKKDDDTLYYVKKPGYLRITGNLSVSNVSETQEAVLIIWPLITGGYKYGLRIQKDGFAHEIYVNENQEPVNIEDTVNVEKVKEYKAELEELFSKANEMWQLE